jgi:hypothetical protein
LFDFPVSVDLPAGLVVSSIVQKLAVIAEATVSSQLVILAHI